LHACHVERIVPLRRSSDLEGSSSCWIAIFRLGSSESTLSAFCSASWLLAVAEFLVPVSTVVCRSHLLPPFPPRIGYNPGVMRRSPPFYNLLGQHIARGFASLGLVSTDNPPRTTGPRSRRLRVPRQTSLCGRERIETALSRLSVCSAHPKSALCLMLALVFARARKARN